MQVRNFVRGRTFATVFALVAAGVLMRGSAQPALAADPLSYDDPGMHFKAPDGWTRVETPPFDADSSDKQTVAVFTYHAGKRDERSIVITIEPYSDSLDAFEHGHESDARSGSDSAFIEEHEKVALANGMPAYYFKVRTGDVGGGRDVERCEYLVIDTQRAIDVAFVGAVGEFSDKDVKEALSSLYVVVYPGRRRN